ncbi:IS630 family transposase [Candidatus Mesenet endosymbiont of Phosphuga atrata]|uniref:IS630 family transposase n=1 Tax=Candidatus Mesenet endosymbiont of Phosphuga atrata TaxID=3066221 RepID=UPI0030D05F12
MDHSSIVYVDEAGVDNRLYREYGRALRGEKIYADILGKKRQRISMIGGWIEKRFIAPMTFTGGCDKEVFNMWLGQILLPQLQRGTTIIMDNATFHKTAKTKELIESAYCHLLYLPTYSPDLNPIEHCWHTIKSWLRPRMYQQENLLLFFGKAITEAYHLV